MTDIPDDRLKAEEFADWTENMLRSLGTTGDYFCAEQRVRWRQHAVDAFFGRSPDPLAGLSLTDAAPAVPDAPDRFPG